MAPPPARSFFPSYFSMERLLPPVRDSGYTTSDAFPSSASRNGDPNQGIIQVVVAETCSGGAALEHGEGETRRSQQLNMGLKQLAAPPLPRLIIILDSGATNHVVGDISLLSSVTTVTATPAGTASAAAYRVRIRDGRQLPIAGVGTVNRDGFHLPDVLYAPGFRAGVVLVSVSKLSERGYLVVFGRGRCHVQDQSSGDVVGKGQLHSEDGLYHLEYLKIPPDDTSDESTVPPNGTLHRHPAIS